jgi:flagellar basal-body rod modification protein FlgD
MGTIARTYGLPITPNVASTVFHKLVPALSSAKGATAPATPTPATTTGAADTSTGAAAAAAASTSDTPPISEADFMQILVTQLENQDPMNPLQPDQLASELAQFTSVQELAQLNTDATSQLTAVTSNTDAVQASMASSLIGHPVLATGGEVDVSSSSSTTNVLADIGSGGGQGVLTLSNSAGQTVGSYNLGNLPGGPQQVLSFKTSGVAAGPYNYSVTVTNSSGAVVPVTTYIAGTVSGVDLSSGSPILDIGDLSAPVSNLVQVFPLSTSSSSPTS